jgi:2-amino-4-hydroxy-6-hydroxymethyldihydropteridine diphosphokinase
MNKAYLLTGGNLGNRQALLKKAAALLNRHCGRITRRSALYETAAWGNTNQPSFLNQVLVLETKMDAAALMKKILSIEVQMGRRRNNKWEPRIIDIDILFFNKEIINSALVTVPHPHIPNRRFVLAPLNELSPSFIHPVSGMNIHQLLKQCKDKLKVEKMR